jgi:DUF1680 family protein
MLSFVLDIYKNLLSRIIYRQGIHLRLVHRLRAFKKDNDNGKELSVKKNRFSQFIILCHLFFFAALGAVSLSATPSDPRVDEINHIVPFNYEGVELLPGPLYDQYHQVKDFYLKLRNNDILKGFRARHGNAPGDGIGGAYENGALTFGQWLSAYSRMYKVTGDNDIKRKTLYLMNEWGKTIDEDGFFGYKNPPHNPGHYIYDKMVGGLADVYEYIGDENAIQYLDRITTWAENNLDRSNPYALPTEWYTLTENLYRVYQLTGDKRYYDFGKVWEYTDFWSIFARKESPFQEILKSNPKHESYHAYSHVNALSSAAKAYEVTGQDHYLDTIVNAYDWLKATQMFATGGLGPEENFVVPNGLPEVLIGERRGESNVDIRFHFETACGSWAAFKLSRYLMQFTGQAQYGDWAERIIYNGVGAMPQVNDDGMIMYGSCYHFHGAQKSLFTTWFCCSGTYPIDVTDYHNLIYYKDKQNLYVNLFVPSKVKWNGPGGTVVLTQKTQFPKKDTVDILVDPEKPAKFGVKFRVPVWANKGIKVSVNGQPQTMETQPGSWATIDRQWKPGDSVRLEFDLSPYGQPLPGLITPVAVMCGPVVMVKCSARQDEGYLPNEGDLVMQADRISIHGKVVDNDKHTIHTNQVFRPFYDMKIGEYYKMYFHRQGKKVILPEDMAFEGDWSADGLLHSATKAGSSFEATFKGSAVIWEGLGKNDAGIAKVFIDGKEIAGVDQYRYTDTHVGRLDQREVPFRWSIADIGSGKHTIRIVSTGKKSKSSTGSTINVTRLLVYP